MTKCSVVTCGAEGTCLTGDGPLCLPHAKAMGYTEGEPEPNAEVRLARALLAIAKLAMPDTFYATDSRCQLARRVLRDHNKLPKSEARFLRE